MWFNFLPPTGKNVRRIINWKQIASKRDEGMRNGTVRGVEYPEKNRSHRKGSNVESPGRAVKTGRLYCWGRRRTSGPRQRCERRRGKRQVSPREARLGKENQKWMVSKQNRERVSAIGASGGGEPTNGRTFKEEEYHAPPNGIMIEGGAGR